jgi:hypothetical protein
MSFQNQPLGTVISSVLDFAKFCIATNQTTTIDLKSTNYVPCDGRIIVGSTLAKLYADQSMNQVPDLRGKFIRGLNIFDPSYQGGIDINLTGDPDGDGRFVNHYQPDEVKHHNHRASGILPQNVSASNLTHDVDEGGDKWNSDPTFLSDPLNINNRVKIIMDENPGKESRPRNIALYYYIKIN